MIPSYDLLQTQVVATAAAGVAAEGLSPRAARAEAEAVAQLSMSLAENALVVLMLVEDHLRLQCQVYGSNSLGSTTGQSTSPGTRPPSSEGSYDFAENPVLRRVSSSYDKSINSLLDLPSPRRYANGNEPSGVSLEVTISHITSELIHARFQSDTTSSFGLIRHPLYQHLFPLTNSLG